MNEITQWIRKSKRNYLEGLELYHKYKTNTKHDQFLNTEKPTDLHKNMLLSRLLRLEYKVKAQPAKTVQPTPQKITVKKINPVKSQKTASPAQDPSLSRKNKAYVNKLLAANWSDLSFNDKAIFDQSEKMFLDKKALFIENSDLMRDMQSLHAKMRALPEDANDERAEILEKISISEARKDQNWKIIDNWEVKETSVKNDISDTEKELIRLKNEKLIKQHKVYIYRYQNMMNNWPNETAAQKKRIAEKQKEIDRRKQILIDLGSPYVPTKKAKRKIRK